jgi:hypothetical protein
LFHADGQAGRRAGKDINGKVNIGFSQFSKAPKTEIFAKIYEKNRKLSEKLFIITTVINYLHVLEWCWLIFAFFSQVAVSKSSRHIKTNEEEFMRCCFTKVTDGGNLRLTVQCVLLHLRD